VDLDSSVDGVDLVDSAVCLEICSMELEMDVSMLLVVVFDDCSVEVGNGHQTWHLSFRSQNGFGTHTRCLYMNLWDINEKNLGDLQAEADSNAKAGA